MHVEGFPILGEKIGRLGPSRQEWHTVHILQRFHGVSVGVALIEQLLPLRITRLKIKPISVAAQSDRT